MVSVATTVITDHWKSGSQPAHERKSRTMPRPMPQKRHIIHAARIQPAFRK